MESFADVDKVEHEEEDYVFGISFVRRVDAAHFDDVEVGHAFDIDATSRIWVESGHGERRWGGNVHLRSV
jgi:hypothetical protein